MLSNIATVSGGMSRSLLENVTTHRFVGCVDPAVKKNGLKPAAMAAVAHRKTNIHLAGLKSKNTTFTLNRKRSVDNQVAVTASHIDMWSEVLQFLRGRT